MKKIILGLMILYSTVFADKITIFAASDLKFALDEIKNLYTSLNKDININLIYGSSGKGMNQIENGAPFDLYFSANEIYVENLYKKGLLIEKPKLYGLGRIAIWSKNKNFDKNKGFDNLKEPWVSKIAIANPEHAPYGEKSKQALEKVGLYKEIEKNLVFAENISAATNMINIQATQIGIIALSLVLAPNIEVKDNYYLIDKSLHEPLFQAYSITKYAQNNKEAKEFYKFISSDEALKILKKYGFEVPNE